MLLNQSRLGGRNLHLYQPKTKARSLADKIQKELVAVGFTNRVEEANFHVLRKPGSSYISGGRLYR